MSRTVTPRWVRVAGFVLPRRYRAEILDDLLEERSTLLAGRSRLVGAAWVLAHVVRSAVASRVRRVNDGPERAASSRRTVFTEAWWFDLRDAYRGLARDRRLVAFVVVTLALGIGANATTFRLADRLLGRGPEHVTDPDRLVRFYRRTTTPTTGEQTAPWLPFSTYVHLRDGLRTVDAIGAGGVRDTMVGRGPSARLLRVSLTTGAYFPVLGVQPTLGHFFRPTDDAAAAGWQVVLSDGVWESTFARDPGAVGRLLLIDGRPHTIVGIAPQGFTGPDLGRVDAWVLADSRTAGSYNWSLVGRLRPSASVVAASAEAGALHAQTDAAEPVWMRDATVLAAPIEFDDTARESVQAQMARWMAGVSAIILLITCANVINLLLVRLARRRRELGIRVALGSGRARVIRLVALEGAFLAVAGGGGSVWLAARASPILERALFPDDPEWIASAVDARTLAIAGAIAVGTAVLIGLVPALQVARPQLTAALRERTDRGAARSRVRSALTIAQSALCAVLLAGAGLFVHSLAEVSTIPLGFDPDRVLVVEARLETVPPPAARDAFAAYLDGLARRDRQLYRRVADAVRRVPGVERASVTLSVPFEGGFTADLFVPGLERVPAVPGGGPYVTAVSDDYFPTLGTRLLGGRPFSAADHEGTEPVAIVDETAARRLFAGRDAIGRCVRIESPDEPCARVVGVAQDVHRVSLSEDPSLQVYIPLGQERHVAGARLIVRPAAGAGVAWPVLQRAILDVDPAIRLVDMHPLSDSLASQLRPLRLGMVTFGASAGLALLTAALGLYGVMAYAVAWRRREIGIRLALGATPSAIRRLVVGSGVGLAAIGVLIGTGLTLASGRWIQAQLFRTSASDPVVLAVVAGVLLTVAVAAGVFPSQRAVRVAPTESLRAD